MPARSGDAQLEGAIPADVGPGDVVTDELGGPKGLEPTRFGDWERKGRCIDF
ncbi:MAG: DUF1674 domain-containing protein [Rhodospirillales bacterium]|nr:DUF1674 domain-containing protein [Rhodospirillales bacterium]